MAHSKHHNNGFEFTDNMLPPETAKRPVYRMFCSCTLWQRFVAAVATTTGPCLHSPRRGCLDPLTRNVGEVARLLAGDIFSPCICF